MRDGGWYIFQVVFQLFLLNHMICSSKSIQRFFLGSVLVPLDSCGGEFIFKPDCLFFVER